MARIRITNELSELLHLTASHVDLEISDVVRRVCRQIRNGRPATHSGISKCVTDSGGKWLAVRGLENPCPSLEEFRRQLAARCLEALDSPRPDPYRPNLREGVDYLLVDQEE